MAMTVNRLERRADPTAATARSWRRGFRAVWAVIVVLLAILIMSTYVPAVPLVLVEFFYR
jgi:hypothetical protein